MNELFNNFLNVPVHWLFGNKLIFPIFNIISFYHYLSTTKYLLGATSFFRRLQENMDPNYLIHLPLCMFTEWSFWGRSSPISQQRLHSNLFFTLLFNFYLIDIPEDTIRRTSIWYSIFEFTFIFSLVISFKIIKSFFELFGWFFYLWFFYFTF